MPMSPATAEGSLVGLAVVCAGDQAERAWADTTRRRAVCLNRRPPQQPTLLTSHLGIRD
jgi:hypothetical protein